MSQLPDPAKPIAVGTRSARLTLLPRQLWGALRVWNLAPTRWLQLAGCALLVFAFFRGSDELTATAAQAHRQSESDVAQLAGLRIDEAALRAALGLTTIDVIVGRHDTLERIFRRLELSLADLASLRADPELRTHLDRLRPGDLIRFNLKGDELFGLERPLSASDTLKVERAPAGFATDVIVNPLEREVRTSRGFITSSLFRAAEAAGLQDATALAIAQIFAWDIDFVLDIQRGDSFTVTYEALSQDGEPVGDGDILAVEFVNAGRRYRAVRYELPDGKVAYFTPDGRSLRKAFLRAPVEFSRISSRFNPQRRHPVLNLIRAHRGVDYAAPIGTPVRAAGDGRVRFVGQQGGYGNLIELDHAGGVVTAYGHLSRFAQGLSRGKRVRQGDVIGYVGMTGLATGPHLHYEYRVRGVHMNPQTVPLPTGEPVPESLLADFQARTRPLLASLDAGAPPGMLAR
jgi:murein DD-endopeptidase MepM/ murein hydrolase activator NlpD